MSLSYLNAVEQNGALPVILSMTHENAAGIARVIDALLLAGGCDVDPALFGQENRGTQEVDARRDSFEIALCREMVALGKPVLGICRGIQVLNVALGGTLIQDIPSWLSINHPNGLAFRHDVSVAEHSFLAPEIRGTWRVNSTHHQAVDALGEGLICVATSEEGRVVEAIQAADGRPIWGVQWHPERLREEDPVMNMIFTKLVRACRM
jgi:putative glutamine amidotransferase